MQDETNAANANGGGDKDEADKNANDVNASPNSKAAKPQTTQKFEYYITYLGHQRRNDRWITEDELRIDEDEIEREHGKYNNFIICISFDYIIYICILQFAMHE